MPLPPSTETDLPYWQVNVPAAQRTKDCPPFLATANDKGIRILSTPDSEYRRLSWPEVVDVVRTKQLDIFQRVPSDLRLYMAYVYDIIQSHGSVMDFVLRERIGWESGFQPRGKPFEDESDVKILCNDWPYGIDEDIVHLVVWTKFGLEDDPATGDLTDRARAEIEAYVRQRFGSMPDDHVVWFKNWKSLKSVEAVEHFHVLLYQPGKAFVAEITGGDVAMQERLKQQKAMVQ